MARKPTWRVPFDAQENLVRYEYDRSIVRTEEPFEFEAKLRYVTYHRGRSAAYFEWQVVESDKLTTDATVYMFLTDLDALLKAGATEVDGTVRGTFTFAKRGQDFGVKLA